MALKKKTVDDVTVIELTGELDHSGMATVKNIINEQLVMESPRVVLDLRRVKGASLMHIGVLVEEMRKLRERGGDLKLVGVKGAVTKVFDCLGTKELFCRFNKVKDAVKDFGGQGESL
jgi:anti-anti-sigma factor